MAGIIEGKLSSLGIALPTPASPIANYVPFTRSGKLLVVALAKRLHDRRIAAVRLDSGDLGQLSRDV